jgi:hypothetical protein
MSTSPKDNNENNSAGGDYLGELNKIYAQYTAQSTAKTWGEMNKDEQFKLVVRSLFVIRDSGNLPVEEIKKNLQSAFGGGEGTTISVVNFMLENNLIKVDAGSYQLTSAGNEIVTA